MAVDAQERRVEPTYGGQVNRAGRRNVNVVTQEV